MLRGMIFFNTNLEREREGLRGMIFFNTNLERERGAQRDDFFEH